MARDEALRASSSEAQADSATLDDLEEILSEPGAEAMPGPLGVLGCGEARGGEPASAGGQAADSGTLMGRLGGWVAAPVVAVADVTAAGGRRALKSLAETTTAVASTTSAAGASAAASTGAAAAAAASTLSTLPGFVAKGKGFLVRSGSAGDVREEASPKEGSCVAGGEAGAKGESPADSTAIG